MLIGKRVQIPAHTDRWMRGDRYGEIVSNYETLTANVVRVKMDRSGQTVTFYADDVTFV